MPVFRPHMRLRSPADFARVNDNSVHAADEVLVVNGAANNLSHARLGLAVSRLVGNAVVRNCWKRLIRESFRMSFVDLPPGIDFVVRPRRGAIPELSSIGKSLRHLTNKVARKLTSKKR